MITERDLDQAIAECQGERNPNANTCIKLAAYYTIKRELSGAEPMEHEYSYANSPGVQIDSDSEFAIAVNGHDPAEVWPIVDELMNAVKILQPKLYTAVLRKLQ